MSEKITSEKITSEKILKWLKHELSRYYPWTDSYALVHLIDILADVFTDGHWGLTDYQSLDELLAEITNGLMLNG